MASSCGVCGSDEIAQDEVIEEHVLHLAHCVRCDHRWTWTGGKVALLRPLPYATSAHSHEDAVPYESHEGAFLFELEEEANAA